MESDKDNVNYEKSVTLWVRDMENNNRNTVNVADICNQLSEKNLLRLNGRLKKNREDLETNRIIIIVHIITRNWRWSVHKPRKQKDSTAKQALIWNPQGKRRQGRPKNT